MPSLRRRDGPLVHPYHPQVTNDRTPTVPSLYDAVRALARGDDLDTTLMELARQACAVGGAGAGVVLLHDASTGMLTLPDGEPLGDPAEGGAPSETRAAGDVAIDTVLRDRIPVWDAQLPDWLAVALPGTKHGAIVPLIREDATGASVEGLLVLGAAEGNGDGRPGGPRDPDTLLAIADLAAVAVRRERLASTSAEGLAYQERLARTDPLTGLADRFTFGQMLELELARAARLGTSLAVAVFDVDDLAAINEQHGAGVGDDILRNVAATIADQVRLVDTVARIGPDEFGVIAPGDPSGIVARRVRDAVAGLAPVAGVRASVRAGVSHHPQDGTSSGDLLEAAHEAITQARAEGAGSVVGLRTEVQPSA